jgi:predicted O-linked N-acetylglucosamine transferase (SPINDLY family)
MYSEKNRTVDEIASQFQAAFSRHQQGNLNQAMVGYQSILKQDPHHFDALHMLAVAYLESGNIKEAMALFDAAVKVNSGVAALYVNWGNALQMCGHVEEALLQYEKALSLDAGSVRTLFNYASAFKEIKNYQSACVYYQKVLEINPEDAEAWLHQGQCWGELDVGQKAIACYQRALEIAPGYYDALFSYGVVLQKQKKFEQAQQVYLQILDKVPEDFNTWVNYGTVLKELKQYQASLECFQKALAIQPEHVEVKVNCGRILRALEQDGKAKEMYLKALEQDENCIEALSQLGILMQDSGQIDKAIFYFKRVFELKPEEDFLLGALAYSKMKICDWSHLGEYIDYLEHSIKEGKAVATPGHMLALSGDAALHYQVAKIYANKEKISEIKEPVRYAHSRIRLAYFSADVHNHATMHLMSDLFELHNRIYFEIYVFSYGVDYQDEMRLKVMNMADHFFDVREKSDEEIVRLARECEIDIAVDLKGYTQEARPGIFARRVAAVQVNYLGYPGTLGADYMDYIVADPVVIPSDFQKHYQEKVVYLPYSYQVNSVQRKVSLKNYTRAELGLPAHGFVFCCFNNNYKITPLLFECWMRLLHQVPGSVLWLLEDNTFASENLRKVAVACGVDVNRLIFAPRLEMQEHLARQVCADLFLDTVPCNAHTTASDALWMGLPVLTCMMENFASRVAASLLCAIGLPELVTHSLEDYENLAVALAQDPQKIGWVKEKLIMHRRNLPLFDTFRYVHFLENAYKQMQQGGTDVVYLKVLTSGQDYQFRIVQRQWPNAFGVSAQLDIARSYFNIGQWGQAGMLCTDILSRAPNNVEVMYLLGNVELKKNYAARALTWFQRCVSLQPENFNALGYCGIAANELGLYKEAFGYFEKILNQGLPDNAILAILLNSSVVLMRLGRFEEAAVCCDRILAVDPNNTLVRQNRAVILSTKCKRLEEALVDCNFVLEKEPYNSQLLLIRGNILKVLGRYEEAIADYAKCLEQNPKDANANFEQSECWLRMGDYERGWPQYEWRWLGRDLIEPVQGIRLREYTQPIQDKIIVVYSEGGDGDVFQFYRYIDLLVKAGAYVFLTGVDQGVQSLMRYSDRVKLGVEGLTHFHALSSLMSLPLFFKTRLETIPASIPYLFSDPEKVKIWGERLGQKKLPRVGIVCSGNSETRNDIYRSIPIARLLTWLDLPAEFVFLQKEPRVEDKLTLNEAPKLRAFETEINDFSDTAAIIEHMDLVISVDTSVAHLAGAMGKPLWVLLGYNSEWRWLCQREDSPWYPQARLFRQTEFDTWGPVIENVKSALTKFLV